MNSTLEFSVRLITQANQLTEALSLRFKTYKKVYPKLSVNNKHPYETDAYDERSIHLGLYYENGTEKKLAGYCRLILPKYNDSEYSNLLIRNHPVYNNGLNSFVKEKMALIERLPFADYNLISSFCSSLETSNISYVETSRIIIDESYRSISISSFFVSSIIAICQSLKIKYCFFTCTRHHITFYNAFGLTSFPGITPFDNEIFGKQFVLYGSDLNISNAKQASIKLFKQEFEEKNKIVFLKAA